MSEPMKGMSCTLGCWIMAGAIGALAFVLMLVVGEVSVMGTIFLSAVATGVLGLIFSFLFCRELPGPVRTTSAPAPRAKSAPTGANAKPAAAPAQTATAKSSVSDAKPDVRTASSDTDAESGASVKPSKALSGEEDLKSRKGNWKYEGDTAASAAVEGEGTKPAMLEAARAEGADDLKKIKGIGPKLEELCNSMGFYHFDQIAAWTSAEVAWVDQNLEGFKGRVTRDEWVPQAKSLAAGNETEFSKRVDKGDVY